MMNHLKKYFLIAKTSLQNSIAYSANLGIGTFFYLFIIFVFLMLWKTIYGSGSTIEGYTLNQMIWYCIVTEMVCLSAQGDVFETLNNDIKGGNIAYLLNKPYHYIAYQFANYSGQVGVKLGINVIAGILMGLVYVGPLNGFNIIYLPFMLISAILGMLLNFFMKAVIGLTAFWVEDNDAFFWIFSKLTLILGLFLPVEFFPKWLQSITLALPFPYITYGPAKLVVDFSMAKLAFIIPMQMMYLGLFMFLTSIIYAKGAKKLNVNGG